MFERRCYPLVDMDPEGREKFAMFGSTDSEDDAQRHDLCLIETVPRYYRLRSKAPLDKAADKNWHIHCPLCTRRMQPISSPVDSCSRSLYCCPMCAQKDGRPSASQSDKFDICTKIS